MLQFLLPAGICLVRLTVVIIGAAVVRVAVSLFGKEVGGS